METETFEAYRQDLPRGGYESPGRNKSERVVASKVSIPEGRACNRRAKAEWPAEHWPIRLFTLAGWKRQHGDKDMLSNWRNPPRPVEKSPEQGRPYNRRNREVGRRREGGGWVHTSDEAE